ncbi:hypothetical protein DL96DRAFT_21218 [Flagelloscypha sp. PMI_526]|nr:hypothetical protein DL96DRAFT_21218 [Flagelloscypha sp. PMI_526]
MRRVCFVLPFICSKTFETFMLNATNAPPELCLSAITLCTEPLDKESLNNRRKETLIYLAKCVNLHQEKKCLLEERALLQNRTPGFTSSLWTTPSHDQKLSKIEAGLNKCIEGIIKNALWTSTSSTNPVPDVPTQIDPTTPALLKIQGFPVISRRVDGMRTNYPRCKWLELSPCSSGFDAHETTEALINRFVEAELHKLTAWLDTNGTGFVLNGEDVQVIARYYAKNKVREGLHEINKQEEEAGVEPAISLFRRAALESRIARKQLETRVQELERRIRLRQSNRQELEERWRRKQKRGLPPTYVWKALWETLALCCVGLKDLERQIFLQILSQCVNEVMENFKGSNGSMSK